MLDGCCPISEFIKNLDKVMFLENEADIILHGHGHDYDDISLMRCLRQGCVEICEGKKEQDEPYRWFGGVGRQHGFVLEPGKHYQQDHSVICYDPGNIHSIFHS